MVFCSKCGTELTGSEDFCPGCGTKLNNQEETKSESKSIFKSSLSRKIQKIGKDAKNQIDNFDFEEFKEDASKTTTDTIDDIKDYADESARKSNFKKAESNIKKGNYEKTIEYCDKILDDSFREDAYLLKAKATFCLKRYDDVIDLITPKLDEVDNLEYPLLLAETYRMLHKYNISIEYYDKILEIDENYFDALIGKSYAYYDSKNYSCACDEFLKSESIHDLKDNDYYLWALSLKNLRNFDDAYEKIEKAFELNENDKYEKEAEIIHQKMILNSTDLELIYSNALHKFKIHDYEISLRFLWRYIRLDSNNKNVWELIAKCYYYLTDYNSSLLYCDKLLEFEETDETLNLKGEILIGLENYNEAITTFNQALKINPKNSQIYANIGFANYFLNYSNKAKENFDKSLEYSNNHNSRAWMGKTLAEYKFADLYTQAGFRYSKKDSIEELMADLMQSFLSWNTAHGLLKRNLTMEVNDAPVNDRQIHEEAEKKFIKSYEYLQKGYELYKKLNLSKDFWLISEFLEQIDFNFSNLAKDNHYNMYYHQYRYHYKEMKNSWLKTGNILNEIYGNVSYLINQGKIYEAFHEYNDAIKIYDKALELNNKSLIHYDLLYYKAVSYKSEALKHDIGSRKFNKNRDNAVRYFEASLRGYELLLNKNPNDEELLLRKGLNLAKYEHRAEAILIFEKVLKINPENIDAQNDIDHIYDL